ncbi:MAG: 2-oxoglutarate oxidoreductase [Oscillospiraceae bacterium]|nr:2-oxoglutarate oxidoreductase [Oscillospiraceae bacterium]
MEKVYSKPSMLPDFSNGWCPGCGHSITHKLLAQGMEKYKMSGESILVVPVGCGTLSTCTGWFDCNSVATAHGRAAATATAIKRCCPDSLVVAYQGDGDLASIGMAETIHAANRGTPITVIFVNNNIYGMTGGQMAPTTLIGQKATTAVYGRNLQEHGAPIRMAELIAGLDAPVYVARVSLHDAKHVMQAGKAIEKALDCQVKGLGYSFIEILSPCPTNAKLAPVDAMKHIADEVVKVYPLGVMKNLVD